MQPSQDSKPLCVATELPLAAVEATKRLQSRENALGEDLRKAWVAIYLVIMTLICFMNHYLHSIQVQKMVMINYSIFFTLKTIFRKYTSLSGLPLNGMAGLLNVRGKSSSYQAQKVLRRAAKDEKGEESSEVSVMKKPSGRGRGKGKGKGKGRGRGRGNGKAASRATADRERAKPDKKKKEEVQNEPKHDSQKRSRGTKSPDTNPKEKKNLKGDKSKDWDSKFVYWFF